MREEGASSDDRAEQGAAWATETLRPDRAEEPEAALGGSSPASDQAGGGSPWPWCGRTGFCGCGFLDVWILKMAS